MKLLRLFHKSGSDRMMATTIAQLKESVVSSFIVVSSFTMANNYLISDDVRISQYICGQLTFTNSTVELMMVDTVDSGQPSLSTEGDFSSYSTTVEFCIWAFGLVLTAMWTV